MSREVVAYARGLPQWDVPHCPNRLVQNRVTGHVTGFGTSRYIGCNNATLGNKVISGQDK